MMKLLTKELEKKIPRIGNQEYVEDPVVHVHYFHPLSSWDWYGIEFDPSERIFFGWVRGDFPELGSFSLDELESVKVEGIGMERDLYFEPRPLSEIRGGEV